MQHSHLSHFATLPKVTLVEILPFLWPSCSPLLLPKEKPSTGAARTRIQLRNQSQQQKATGTQWPLWDLTHLDIYHTTVFSQQPFVIHFSTSFNQGIGRKATESVNPSTSWIYTLSHSTKEIWNQSLPWRGSADTHLSLQHQSWIVSLIRKKRNAFRITFSSTGI